MSLHQSSRIALHLLLAVFLVVPGIIAPAQAVADLFHAPVAEASAMGTPCEDMAMPASDASPCDCCEPGACDLAACLGTGCLPELHGMVANVPPAAMQLPWWQPHLPSGVADTPLRPPIA